MIRATSLVLTLLYGVGVANVALAQDEPLRFIETAQGRAWLNMPQLESLSRRSHREGHCGGFFDITYRLPAQRQTPLLSNLATRSPTQAHTIKPLLVELSSRNLYDTVASLSKRHDRYYESANGAEAATWIHDKFVELGGSRKNIQVEYFNHEFRQPSVIARIQGHGVAAKQRVVLGAHLDSINWDWGMTSVRRAPGADDDASGIATLLEVFRVLAAADYKPKKTLEFIAYAGEELGLLGSQDIADAYAQARTAVVAVLQMDMVMYPSKAHKLAFVVDNTNRPLTRFTQKLVRTYLQVDFIETSCGYACSDHASWDKNGFPTVFPFEGSFENMNPRIHTEDDILDHNLDAEHALLFAKLNTAFAVEMTATAK